MFSSAAASKPCASQSTLSSPYLRWEDRTPEINHSISRAFKAIVSDTNSSWGLYNGSNIYAIGGVKEHKLMRKLIREAPPENKDFYALDIGAGNYQWGRELAKYLNAKKDIPKDVTIHIIGIRGETNLDKAVTELGCCRLYEFGQFKIERLIDEFQLRGLQLANKVDLVISRWCFRHLVDPVGTFTQAYDLLRPKTGHLLLDGFFFLHADEKIDDKSLNAKARMIQLCLETRAPFLTRRYDDDGSLDHFMLRKPDAHSCRLQKQYLRIENLWGWQNGSKTITRFKELKENGVVVTPVTQLLWKGEYRGDKDMYERLRQNGLLHRSDLAWGPLQDKDNDKKKPPFHIAIANGDEEAIDRCLKEGCDINESDDTGATPLYVAIKHNNYKLFSHLLQRGAQTKLFAGECTPLHFAAQYDSNGRFVADLIKAGADVNTKSELRPLDCAIEHKNVKAVELLLAAKAIVNYKNRKSLDSDSTFSSIQHLLPKKLSESEGFDIIFDSIIDHIQKGDCVLLTHQEGFLGYKFKKSTQLGEESRLIRVIVNPETRLLDDGNYEEIGDITDCRWEFAFGEDRVPHLELRFGY